MYGNFINYKTQHQKKWNLGRNIVGALWVQGQKAESQMEKREKGQSYKWAPEVTSKKINLKVIIRKKEA